MERDVGEIQCQNIVVLVHEMYELRLDPTFGERAVAAPEATEDEPRIRRFPGT
jgi:hypothetical protein